jgi:hypothetical protein
MANALAFAFRRSFARTILVVGLVGFIWAAGFRKDVRGDPVGIPWAFSPRLVDRTLWDIPVAAAVLVLAGLLAALIWRARSTSRSS